VLHHIEQLQKKSPHARKRVAFFVSLFVTLLIAGVWASTIGPRMAEDSSATENTEEKGAIDTLKDRLSNVGSIIESP
jgi:hypothetical protein